MSRSLCFLLAIIVGTLPASALALTFEVNGTGDGDDVFVGNGICDADAATSGPQCTLRAAIQEANALAGDDRIEFLITNGFSDGTGGFIIALTKALPELSTNIEIVAHPTRPKMTVRRGTGGSYRIFNVTTAVAVTITGLTISNGNSVGASGAGGAIANANSATVSLNDCTFSGNSAVQGGALANFGTGTMNVRRCTFTNNLGLRQGGAVHVSSGVVNLINCTLSGNSVTSPDGTIGGLGGACYSGGGALNVWNSTLTGNSADISSGGIRQAGGIVRLQSSIVALNSAGISGPDLEGVFTSQGYNLIGKNDGAAASFPAGNPNASRDIVGTSASPIDPMLDPAGLQYNGGATQTIGPLLGSPVIDKGINAAGGEPTDQRGTGFARTRDNLVIANATNGDATDIGAFEFNGPLRLTSIMRSGSNIVIGFAGVEGFTYRLERKLAITFEYWENLPVADITLGPTAMAEIIHPDGVTAEASYYRVRLLP